MEMFWFALMEDQQALVLAILARTGEAHRSNRVPCRKESYWHLKSGDHGLMQSAKMSVLRISSASSADWLGAPQMSTLHLIG